MIERDEPKRDEGGKIEIEKSIKNVKNGFNKTLNFLKQKKILNIIVIVLLLLILIGGTWIRLQNLPLLKDSTTGEYIPLALDPFYFLRVSETMIENGSLPAIDSMRYPALKIGFTNELLPRANVGLYQVIKIFNQNLSFRFFDVISPVIFFALGLIAFFFLVFVLTKSKKTALISTGLLAIIPSYLYRTMAGFADHESLGMFGFYTALLLYSLSLIFINKELKKNDFLKIVLLSLATSFFTAFTTVSWGGIGVFLYMIIPLSFLIFWLVKSQEKENNFQKKLFLLFYSIWIIFSVLFGLILGFNLNSILARFILSSSGLISLFVLGFVVIDYILMKNIGKIKSLKEKYREIYSLGIIIVLGILFLFLIGKNPFQMIGSIWDSLLHPFGTERVGLTIAENAQPYLLDWIGQTGKILFWIFILGLVIVGFEVSRKIKPTKNKVIFILVWIFMFSGILFSRISSISIFNGTNFISQAFYLIGLILFAGYATKLYFNKKIKLKPEIIIIASWMFFMIISGRSAIRFFFALTPFVAFIAGYSVIKLFDYTKKNKDEFSKILLAIILISVVVGLAISSIGFIKSTTQQAKVTGPSANYQWQQAMSWVRENTSPQSIFVHWWDYGYWVQYLGERATITDGGHANGFWDHLIGRYLLTTPYPETALSFMKSHNVSYLLIDPTDLGKYPAYSRIGGDENNDRFSSIPIISSDPSQTKETATGMIKIYNGGWGVDQDLVYNKNGTEIFLPGPIYNEIEDPVYQSFIGAIILEIDQVGNQKSIGQPRGIFFYNGNQIEIPLRYAYYGKEIIDFGSGVESVFHIIPRIASSEQGIEMDEMGSGIYLSPKVSKSLVAQLYLMDDPYNKYSNVKLVHTESNLVVDSLKLQGVYFGEFIDYQGFQGPIKIWEIEENSNIVKRDEFLKETGKYAEFDDLQFIK